jgi:sigma-B regulation protein RsbU (phosphoserine phosphatase)
MRGKTLVLIAPSLPAGQQPLVDGVLAHWDEADQPRVVERTFGQLQSDKSALADAGVAWVIIGNDAPVGLYAAIEKLQDSHIPTVLTRAGQAGQAGTVYHDGVIVGPADAPPSILCAMLRALWSQIEVIQTMHSELKLLGAQQGGLCGQIESIDEELRLAAQLQLEFLPRTMPRVGPVEFRALFRPAGYVSGDIYDVERLDEEHVAFFIADAVGHGVPAALLTMYIKRSLQTKRISDDVPHHYQLVSPDEALEQLNKDIYAQQSGKVRFATACYGVINCKTLELCFARAGHPYPLLLGVDGSCRLLQAQGALLGVFPDEKFEMMRVQLSPGDRLLLYSDGFEVAFDQSNKIEYTEQLKMLAHGPIDEAIAKLSVKLDRQRGSLHQDDDMTALLIHVGASAAPAHAAAPGDVVAVG